MAQGRINSPQILPLPCRLHGPLLTNLYSRTDLLLDTWISTTSRHSLNQPAPVDLDKNFSQLSIHFTYSSQLYHSTQETPAKMQFKTIALASFLGLAAAASDSDVSSLAAQLPSCSTSCLDDAASSQGCDSTDYTCLCENMDAISKNATSCLTSSCSISNITGM